MKELLTIVRRNFGSPIVIAIFILAVALLALGEGRDAWFISSVILLNTTFAVAQEIRARMALKKLELMSAPHARKIKSNGEVVDILYNQLRIGDNIRLQLGDEVPADGSITVCDGLEIDESILTGESAPIDKSIGALVLASCSVVAGSAEMKVTAVSANTRIGQMTSTLKRYEPELTPIQHKIFQAITVLTYGALGLALLIFVIYYLSGQDAVKILKVITSAAVTVVPEGLLLASSLLLAYGSIRLAQAKVLPQKLAAIEAMALLDILCVDKTGTLTSDKIAFEKLELFHATKQPIDKLVGIVARETSGGSNTGSAIAAGLPIAVDYEIIQTLAFSSARKLSGLRVKVDNELFSVVMGAPEYVSRLAKLSDSQQRQISKMTNDGKRVLLVATFSDTAMSLRRIPEESGRAVGIVVLSNELRDGVRDTVKYLQDNKVNLRVISGDNPNTVSYVARQAGIKGSDMVLSGAELTNLSNDEWDSVVMGTTVFARVLPDQKERLIDTFRTAGKFTGMVGDGINDALAIKKSDLGVAMYDGATATRRVADIVLLNNSFNSFPIGMKLGNRIMQAIEIIATLFFHKIIYSVVLLISTFILQIAYPFAPRHITFMNIFLVSMPTLMWTVFSPIPSHKVSPKYFWKDTLMAVIPIAAISGAVVSISYAFLSSIHTSDVQGVATTTVIIATFLGVYLVWLVPKMFNIKNDRESKLARLLYVLSVASLASMSFGVGFVRDFFDFTTPAWHKALPLLVLIISAAIFQWKIAGNAGLRLAKRER